MKKQNSHKQIENQAQRGRSMVEMLGVLVIIAILTIGGLVGFRYAMNYYQANQIAHEMNMMRTDAKVKVAQGAKKLTLGSPYDDKKTINFNDYPTDFGFTDSIVDSEDQEEDTEKEYYITVLDVSSGVCKPLASLLNGMNGKTALLVNNNNYDVTANLCNLEKNSLTARFSAENITGSQSAGAGQCENESDCNGGYCQNHICIQCKESNDCGEFEVCDQQEGRCTTDCTKGACNNGFCVDGVCKECKNMEDCNNGLACKNNQCVHCENETDCEGKHCLTGNCVDCTRGADCTDGKGCLSDNTCGACIADSQCESNNCQDGACKNCTTSADCTNNRACEHGICYDSCVEHSSGCENGTRCDSNTLKCERNCQSSEECPDLQVCNSYSGQCEDDCTKSGAMACKTGSHCDTTNKKCVKDCTATDCTGATPYCNPTSKVCEKCTDDSQCGTDKHCKADGSCVTCSGSTPYWNETIKQCVACTENTHCSGTTPICNTNIGVCEKCTDESQCGTDKHCKTDGSCVTCNGSTPYWNTSKKQCVACTENSHCSGTTPICNTNIGVCEKCTADSQCGTGNHCKTDGSCVTCNGSTPIWNETKKQCDTCYNVNSLKPKWNGTACVECGDGTQWNGSTCAEIHCTSNAQCGSKPMYCFMAAGYVQGSEFGGNYPYGVCRNANTDKRIGSATGYKFSTRAMTRDSAKRFCTALNSSLLTYTQAGFNYSWDTIIDTKSPSYYTDCQKCRMWTGETTTSSDAYIIYVVNRSYASISASNPNRQDQQVIAMCM